jgi:CHAT domain-containing protein/tetratricopeptide (TPR) repeat protein
MIQSYKDEIDRLNKKVTKLLRETRYGDALEPALQAREWAVQYLAESDWNYVSSISNLAHLYTEIGKYTEAETLYRQSWEIDTRILGEKNLAVVADMSNLAKLCTLMGRFIEAERLYLQAIHICTQVLSHDHPQITGMMDRLASLYLRMARYQEAKDIMEQAIDLLRNTIGEKQLALSALQTNFAGYYREAGMYTEAESLYLQVAKFEHDILGEYDPSFAITVHELAALYCKMGKYDEAEPLLAHSVEVWRRAGDDHLAYGLNTLGWLYLQTGKYAEAEPLLLQALELKEQRLGKDHPDICPILSNLSELNARLGQMTHALAFMSHVIAIDDRMIGQILSGSSERHRLQYLQSINRDLNMYLSLVLYQRSSGAVRRAFNVVLRRKGLTTEMSTAQRDAAMAGKYPELATQLDKLTALRTQIARKTLGGPGQESLEAHLKTIHEMNLRKEWLEAELGRHIPEMNLEKRLSRVHYVSIAGALSQDSALIDITRFSLCDFGANKGFRGSQRRPARYVAFVMRAETPDAIELVDLGEAEELDDLILIFRGMVTLKKRINELEQGKTLTKALIDPIANFIKGCKRLYISPDGEIARLPFEILPLDDDRRMIDEYEISYLGTGRDLFRFGQALTKSPTQPLIIADPDFDLQANTVTWMKRLLNKFSRDLDRSQIKFKPLMGTRREGKVIGRMLKVKPWLQDRALETRLKASHSPHVLHIATHGFFLENQKHDSDARTDEPSLSMQMLISNLENPLLRSGLALAGANTQFQGKSPPPEAEDGLLTAEDVIGLDLSNTELVVLSACETGLGEIRVGEGVFGLRRAFVLSGARTLIMSLWQVPDEQTRDLMIEFYRRILKGESRSGALRNSQLTMRAKYPDPLYWGAFICQGDPAPLQYNIH